MSVKIAVLTDVHYDSADSGEHKRRRWCADILLERAVARINRFIKPDVTLLLGDLTDDGTLPQALDDLRRLRKACNALDSPTIAVPGNHDPDAFYAVFERPDDWVDIAGVRFVPFDDPEAPKFCATRLGEDLARMKAARTGFDGPLISLQHVPIFPPGTDECRYNYTNVDDVMRAMRESGYALSISGHHHKGVDLIRDDSGAYLVGPALCESPFAFLAVTLDGDDISVERQELVAPKALGLVDAHIHTPFAYCNDDMDIAKAVRLADEFGLAGMGFAEHSTHLYFSKDEAWGKKLNHTHGLSAARDEQCRSDAYFAALADADVPRESIGLEVDCDFKGRPVLSDDDRKRIYFQIGAIHYVPEMMKAEADADVMGEELLGLLRRFLPTGFRTLAHPFRIFRRKGLPAPSKYFQPVADLLHEHGVAAELNFHTNDPPPEFVRACFDSRVRLTFGSDAHHLYEIGDFQPQLSLLRECGFDGDLADVVIDPRQERRSE